MISSFNLSVLMISESLFITCCLCMLPNIHMQESYSDANKFMIGGLRMIACSCLRVHLCFPI
ncbi:hypothetical protein HanXRQr2_Chr13g0612641 [Helianthus annuus]|uniref:Uncharacterized protein n=1 Tax=Helianthus annuus TaxID=4232 RepID=A0A9K3EMT2_HELAN|nr:hypothetical protein HanXRQr2_Chr13g0612641 [Helianthus annuus]